MRIYLIGVLVVFIATRSIAQDLAAFPGAEGFGQYTTGGRGGKVYIVTNLNDDGPGSFRDAVRKKEPRVITFAVSGTIALESPLSINSGHVTIAGQTAPGDGICFKNYQVSINADNVIIRYLRFRLGSERKTESDAFNGTKHKNIIIDHCSISWSTDECASFYRNSNFTMQWCIISESLNQSVHQKGEHGYGGIWGGLKASFHHNLIANHTSRLPRFSGSSTTPNDPKNELVDFRNNVIYNWEHNNTYGGERGNYNMVNNYYKPGPASKKHVLHQIVNPSAPFGRFYIAGNHVEGYKEVSDDNWKGVRPDKDKPTGSLRAATPFNVAEIKMETAEQAYLSVLDHVGASLRRDPVDARIVNEVKTGKSENGKSKNGIIDSQEDVGGWPELKSLAAPNDGDADGMPDEWEIKNKLNPKDPSDAGKCQKDERYTNIEVYINEIISRGDRDTKQ